MTELAAPGFGKLGGVHGAAIGTADLEHCERCEVASSTLGRVIRAIRAQRPDLGTEPLERLTGFVDQLAGDGTTHGS